MSTRDRTSAATISTAPAEHPALDFEALRLQAIDDLQRLCGGSWTDFNLHDPGVTILEALCYAITDLAYRISHDLPDLLAEAGGGPLPHLFTPGELLTSAPVTLADLRRVAVDVDGVRNAWVEPLRETTPTLYYHEGRRELSLRADDETAERVDLRGLYRVLIEKSELSWRGGALVEEAVARRLHAHRGLCEDFAEIVILDPQDARVHAEIEIAGAADPRALILAVYRAIAEAVSPPVRFSTLAEAMAAGVGVDAIFRGPRLDHGFLGDDALARAERRTQLHTSDLIHAIMDVPGVRAIRRIALSLEGGRREPWTVTVGERRAPRLCLTELAPGGGRGPLTVTLVRDGVAVAIDEAAVLDAHTTWLSGQVKRAPGIERDLRAPTGRARELARHTSIQRSFPATYGVGEAGLPASASTERRAEAQQLRAYLTIFDQILALCFAQLAHARALLAFDGDPRSYAAQPLDDPAIGPREVWRGGEAPDVAAIQAMVDASAGDEAGVRRHRFLDHLLARFGEQLDDYSLLLYGSLRGDPSAADVAAVRARLAADKAALLRAYPRISARRGAAQDLLRPPGADNQAGLAERVRLRLGLRADEGEDLLVIEHVLLRPIDDDRQPVGDGRDRIPLLAAARARDPYSLQLSVVLPSWPLRLRDPGFRRLVEQTVREETPAHLAVYLRWVDADAWASVREAVERWLALRRGRATL